MKKYTSKNIRLGLFVLTSTLLLVAALYFIGTKKNIFGSTFRISADFYNVNGLLTGNNVRFGGINVGTVEKIEIINDTCIRVNLLIKDKSREFIKKNAIASIGTDGLMGNKLVNINNTSFPAGEIKNGDILKTLRPIETEEMIRTLSRTNNDVATIAKNIKLLTEKINSPNSLWSILLDTVVAENIKEAVVNIKLTSNQTAIVTGDLRRITQEIKSGKNSVGALLTDTSLSDKIKQTIINIHLISDTIANITGNFSNLSEDIKNGKGAMGTILMDTTFVNNLNKSMENIKNGSEGFNQNMEALKHNVLLRKYFKKQEKQTKENLKQ